MPRLNTVGITSNIDALMSSIKKEEAEKQKALKPLTEESLNEDWETYMAGIKSKSVLATLKNVKFEIGTNSLTVYVPTQRTSEVLADGGYFIGFSERFKNDNIDYKINVDTRHFPDYEVKTDDRRPKSSIQDYTELVKKNPNLELLRKTLDLKFDN